MALATDSESFRLAVAVRAKLAAVGWWLATIGLLVLLDDFTYGPVFWLLGLTAGFIAVFVAFSIYFVVQLYLVAEGTKPVPSRAAAALLDRLRLARRSSEIGQREVRVHERVTGGLAAILLAPLIGGVLPALLLFKIGWDRSHVIAISVVTSAIYAAEFAFLHAYVPASLG